MKTWQKKEVLPTETYVRLEVVHEALLPEDEFKSDLPAALCLVCLLEPRKHLVEKLSHHLRAEEAK